MECPFCKIIEKQAEAHVIYETENTYHGFIVGGFDGGFICRLP